MEVSLCAPRLRANAHFPDGSVVKDVLTWFVQQQFGSPEDFYVIRNGRVSDVEDPLQHGAIYHLQPRLCGGKGGFGSMLRALGAQIEKTTNREACRDLSGRRLRDVNHEKEMAEWLKKQADREAEKEQRRQDRLQRKLSEPKHQFADPEYRRQCQDLSERLEDSVLLGLQASSSGHVRVEDVSASKRSNSDQSEQPQKKKRKKMMSSTCFWMGLGELPSSEDEDSSESEGSSSSSACQSIRASEDQEPSETKASEDQKQPETKASEQKKPPETKASEDQEMPETEASEDQEPPETEASEDQEPPETKASEDQEPPEIKASEDQEPPEIKASEDQEPPETKVSEDQEPPETKASEDQEPPETKASEDQEPPEIKASEDQEPPETKVSEDQEPPETKASGDQEPPESKATSDQKTQEQQHLDLSSVSSVHQLESLGLNVLKLELMSRGLKCGGTLSERAARLFCIRGLAPEQIDPALLAKPGKSKSKRK